MVIRSLRREPTHSVQRRRLLLLLGCGVVWTGLLIGRLLFLQVYLHDWLLQRAAAQRTTTVELPARRGNILARGGEVLATSVELSSIYAHPHLIRDVQAAARALAPALGQSIESVQAALSSKRTFVYLQRTARPEVVRRVRQAIRAADLYRAVGMHPDTKRYYPQRSLAAHLLGFVDVDNRGQAGIEYTYDKVVRGRPGKLNTLRDGWNRVIGERGAALEQPTRGDDLVLTIDWALQYAAERAIERAVRTSTGKGGSIVALDPRTGAVLALASYPGYNPNDRSSEAFRRNRLNRVVSWQFEPGSAFKVITAAAALHEGIVTEDEPIDCMGGEYHVTKHIVIRDWKPGFGVMPFRDVLANSSNVGTIQVCRRMSPATFYSWLRDFGFGSPTGIDLPREQPGLLKAPERWSLRSQASMAFGQEIGVTPIQLATAVAAIANGGMLMRPYVVQRVLDGQGHQVHRVQIRGHQREVGKPVASRRVLRPEIAHRVAALMEYVVTSGTGKRAQIHGYRVAGKTSTAEKYDPDTGRYNKYVAGFVGFLPAGAPRVVILALVDEPRRGHHHGSEAAAPAFREVAEAAIRIFRLAPGDPSEFRQWVTESVAGGTGGATRRPSLP